MRLVEHPPGVEPGQGRVDAAAPGGELVAAEEQTGADHVQGADHDGGAGGAAGVLGQVGRQAAPQPSHLKDRLVRAEAEAAAQDGGEFRQRTLDGAVDQVRQVAGAPVSVVDDDSAVDDDVQAQRDQPGATAVGVGRERMEPGEEHGQGLAHAGRDVEDGRNIACGEAFGEPLLVGAGLVPGGGAEHRRELRQHRTNSFNY